MDSENIIKNPPSKYNIDPRGLGRIYYECMLKHKDKVAMICGPTREALTFGEILQRVIRVAIALQKKGIKAGDVIALSIYNNMHSTTILVAGLFLGAVIVGIDEDLPPEDMCKLLKEVTPKVVFVVDAVLELIKSTKAVLNTVIVLVDSVNTSYTLFDEYLESQAGEASFQPFSVKSLQDTAMIFFTSGTTGLPKGFARSHLSLISSQFLVMNCNFCWDVIMETTTPAWPVHLTFLTISMCLGTTRVIYKHFCPDNYWDFTRHKVTFIFLTIYEVLSMCHIGKPNDVDLSDLKTILLGGNILTRSKLDKIKQVFSNATVHNFYGVSEIGAISIFSPRNDHNCKIECNHELSIGTGMPGIDIKVVDLDSGKPLGPNKNGEVRVKIAYSFLNYLNYDSSDLIDEDGWFKTGDLGYYDNDRHVYLIDRIKEVFKYKLYRIVPSLLEDVILKHPGVETAFVTGVPHEVDIEHPMAVVTVKQGFEHVTGNNIQEFVAENVPDYLKLRGGVKIINKFPMTHFGKIRRKLVRTLVAEGKI